MRTPIWTDGLFLNAANVNPAWVDATAAAQEAAGLWMLPGLVHPEAITWGASGLVVSGTMPAPFACVFPSGSVSGLVAGAHGNTAGSDSQSFSIDLTPLVPASGPAVSAYIYAASGTVLETPVSIIGPPQDNPAYNPGFIPFLTYTESVATVIVSASVTPPNGQTTLLLASTTLTSGQSSVSVGSLAFGAQQMASQVQTMQSSAISTTTLLTAAQAGIMQTISGSSTTITLPSAASVPGRIFLLFGGQQTSPYPVIQANGSDSIFGLAGSAGGAIGSFALVWGMQTMLLSVGTAWVTLGIAGNAPLTWTPSSPPTAISVSGGVITLPYPSVVSGSATIYGGASITGLTTVSGNLAVTGSISAIGPLSPNSFSNYIVITSNQTFTVPAGVTVIGVRVVGGGGGGGGSTNSANEYGSAGGGAGGTAVGFFSVTPGQTITIIVGAAGAGGLIASSGQPGGTTYFDSLCNATGGSGGQYFTTGEQAIAPGGVGSGGQMNYQGESGALFKAVSVSQVYGGDGGTAIQGGAGGRGVLGTPEGGHFPGGGGASAGGNAGAFGGAGAQGSVEIWY